MPLVTPDDGSELSQLCSMYDEARRKADDAETHLQAMNKAIKVALHREYPDESRVDLHSEYLAYPLVLRAKTQNRFDTTKFKQSHPDLYDEFRAPVTFWELRRDTAR